MIVREDAVFANPPRLSKMMRHLRPRSLFIKPRCGSFRTCELDVHSSEYYHYRLRHHQCKLCDVTGGMIMRAGIYEICSKNLQ